MADTRTPYQRYVDYCNSIGVKPSSEQVWEMHSGNVRPLESGSLVAAFQAANKIANNELLKASRARRKLERAQAVPVEPKADECA